MSAAGQVIGELELGRAVVRFETETSVYELEYIRSVDSEQPPTYRLTKKAEKPGELSATGAGFSREGDLLGIIPAHNGFGLVLFLGSRNPVGAREVLRTSTVQRLVE